MNVERLERHGATYVGKHEPDFLRSSDPWFRGIEMVYGPDGGVILADWSDIGECHENDGVHRTSGRLFKVTYGKAEGRAVDLGKQPAVDLAKLVTHQNEWFWRHARRILQERATAGQDLSDAKALLVEVYDSDPQVTHRLRCMWMLHSMGLASESWLVEQLDDRSEHVRNWAVQLLVDQGSPSSVVQAKLVALAEIEQSGLVLSFLTAALRRLPHEDRWELAQALVKHERFANDSHYPLLVWYGIEPATAAFPQAALALAESSDLPVVREHVARRLTEEILRQPQSVDGLVEMMLSTDSESFTRDVLRGMESALRGWTRAPMPAGWRQLQRKYAGGAEDPVAQRIRDLSLVFGSGRALGELRELVISKKTPLDVRRRSIQALVAARAPNFAPVLQDLLDTRYINVEAIRGLAAYDHPDTARLLLDQYANFYQPAKQEAISTLISRPGYCKSLLAAIDAGRIDREEMSSFQVRQLGLLNDKAITAAVERIWPELKDIPQQKQEQIRRYRDALTPQTLAGANLSAGRGLFKQNCAKCHRLFDDGELVGPALTGAQRNNLNYLLENIVDPSATVSKDYQLTVVLMEDGRVLSGILIDNDERTLTLRTTNERMILSRDEVDENERMILSRDEVDEILDSQLSLMPDRQLDVMRPEQVRDLIAYLMSPSQVPMP